MNQSFISEKDELVIETTKSQNLVDIFSKVEAITDEKLNTEIAFFEKKRVLPKDINIAGIDATQGGKNLTHDEYVKYEQKVTSLNCQKEALRIALTEWKCLVLPTDIFDKIRYRNGLLVIHPTETGFYKVNKSWTHHRTLWEKNLQEKGIPSHNYSLKEIFNFILGFIGVVLAVIAIEYTPIMDAIFSPYHWIIIPIALVSFVSAFYSKADIKYKKMIEKNIANHRKNFRDIFTFYVAHNATESDLIAYNNKKADLAKLSLPQPPDDVLDVMIAINQKLKDMVGFSILTLADQKAVGLELLEYKREFPVPAPLPKPKKVRDEDPALFVQYGEYTALLPQTFYHLTALEQEFIDEIIELAEKWDARSYIFN